MKKKLPQKYIIILFSRSISNGNNDVIGTDNDVIHYLVSIASHPLATTNDITADKAFS